MEKLNERKCVPCQGGALPLSEEEISRLTPQVEGWEVERSHHLTRTFHFRNFADALRYVNQVGEIAEAEGHHPEMLLSWGKVIVVIYTHKVDGLTENDFILAAKISGIGHG